jgi:hypothetical protein
MDHLSPSSLMQFRNEPKDFYLERLAKFKAPRREANKFMVLGSAFDYYVKAYLATYHNALNHDKGVTESDDALICFSAYKSSGALTSLVNDLHTDIVMESTITKEIQGVPITGKPDLYTDDIIIDWKVGSFYSLKKPSPKKGYLRLFDKDKVTEHKTCIPILRGNILYNDDMFLDVIDPQWALQLCTYGWLCGLDDCLYGIDHVIGNPPRVACYRGLISEGFKKRAIEQYQECWAVVSGDYEKYYADTLHMNINELEEEAQFLNQCKDKFILGLREHGQYQPPRG